MSARGITRRGLLGAAAAGAAAFSLPRLLERAAIATAADQPLNFICLYHPHGISAEFWAMRAGDTETSFDIAYDKCSLQPFDDAATYGKSFKNKILAIEGIDHLSNANGHNSAGTILTGSRIDGNQKPANSSLDQFLAVEKGLGAMTPVTNISLGVGINVAEAGYTLSFGQGGAPLPQIIDPVQAFNVLFANFSVPDDPVARAAAEHKRKVGMSILDFARGEIGDLRAKLGSVEQQKLDQHMTSLREIEKRLQTTDGGTGIKCALPAKPDASKFPKIMQYNGGEPYFDAITDAQIELIANAIACGVTRFATLFMNDLSYAGNPLGLPASNHSDVAHTYHASPIGSNGTPGDGVPASWEPLAKFNRYSYSKVAKLMQRLDELGALDNTIIYCASDMGNPAAHSTRNVPTLLAGGAGGKFRMGRRLRMVADCPTSSPWCTPADAVFNGVTNNHLLVAIAQAFGVTIDTFGTQVDPKDTTGALPGLT
jgi:Protein of unknown function (DUF1552)